MPQLDIQQLLLQELSSKIALCSEEENETAMQNVPVPERNEVTIMIGLDDKKKGHMSVVSYDKEKVLVYLKNSMVSSMDQYEYYFMSEEMFKNNKNVYNSPKNYVMMLLREFKERNDHIKVMKG